MKENDSIRLSRTLTALSGAKDQDSVRDAAVEEGIPIPPLPPSQLIVRESAQERAERNWVGGLRALLLSRIAIRG